MKILMVCLGNICRSPLADGVLRKKVSDAGLTIEVDSAGTANYHVGKGPDSRMCQTAKKFGFPIDDLRARQFVTADYDRFDLIYVMDANNETNVLNLARSDSDRLKVKMILNESHPEKNLEVPDPYYGGDQGFIDVFNLLNEATDVILTQLKNN
jgi:protein-tyrosine phosphatase